MKKIGIYGGTFDPIHVGHLNLAFELMEKGGLDEVWFIPAQISPHKTHQPPTSFVHRLAMLEQVMKDIPPFKVKGMEGQRPPPSYTLHTLQNFILDEKQQEASNQFYLLLGEDSVPGFFRWYQPEEIVKLVSLLIGSRTGRWQIEENQSFDLTVREAIQKGFIQTRIIDISGTELRERLIKNLYCGHLIPAKALDYIHQNQLYTASS
jgi:nicotinate-nucleotide adenylyltransferase